MHTIFRFFATAAVLFGLSLSAHAQSWKPFCVEGGDGQGAHNSTWHLVNTPSAGGGTWKPLGGCVAPPPPPPPPVTYKYWECGYLSYDGNNGAGWIWTGFFIGTSNQVFPVSWYTQNNPNHLQVDFTPINTLQPNGTWVPEQFGSNSFNAVCDMVDTDSNYMNLYNRHLSTLNPPDGGIQN